MKVELDSGLTATIRWVHERKKKHIVSYADDGEPFITEVFKPGGSTTCIIEVTDGTTEFGNALGRTKCSTKDNYDKHIGRVQSLNDAMEKHGFFIKFRREQIWKAYRNLGKSNHK